MKKIIIIQALLVKFFIFPSFGQTNTIIDPQSVVNTLSQDFDFFSGDEILRLAIRFDLKDFHRKIAKEEYVNAIFTYFINDKDSVNRAIKIKSRGIFRKNYCDFPPIFLNFGKNESGIDDPNTPDKIKVVTHCKSGSERYLFTEYLIYRLYNVLTACSFRVRLAKIDYINTAKESKPIHTYCFLIEPLKTLAKRMNAIPDNTSHLTQKHIIPEFMNRMAIFNYMIGNTDWSVPIQHNCRILKGVNYSNSGLGLIVPFDFDYAGLVNTTYAVPYEGLGLKSVRERRFLGVCRSDAEYIYALKEFSEKKPEFYRMIKEFPLLNEKSKKEMTDYLNGFFSKIDNRNTIIYDFLNECIEIVAN